MNVLVTDATSGIGRATALYLTRSGHTVFAGAPYKNAIHPKAVQELPAQARQSGWSLDLINMDITDEASIQVATQQIFAASGQLDVVVHRANAPLIGITEATTVDQAQQIFDANVWGPCASIRPCCHRCERAVADS